MTDFPKPQAGWWDRVPVLHELFKLLSSSDPVNWELATQVGIGLATEDEPKTDEFVHDQAQLESMSRAAAVECENFTGLVPGSVPQVHVVRRSEWVQANVGVFKAVMEPLARKLMSGGLPPGIQVPEQATAVLRQISGVLTGLQMGFVLGYLARNVVGQYELGLPDPDSGRILYVVSNMAGVEADWELDPLQFRYWIALHEVTHHLQFSRSWVRKYFHDEMQSIIESIEINPMDMQQTLGEMDLLNSESMMEALQDPEKLVQTNWTPAGRDSIARLQAFMTLAEGYATFVMDTIGGRILADHARLKEVLSRRKHEASPGETLLYKLLGIDLTRKQYEEGVTFCRYVAGTTDIVTLNKVWSSPEFLPTSDEILNADSWIKRVSD